MTLIDLKPFQNLEMSRTEKRKSFLESQHCHMCNQPLHTKPGAQAGLMSAANMLSGVRAILWPTGIIKYKSQL